MKTHLRPLRFVGRGLAILILSASVIQWPVSTALGDVVKTIDGREFEGTIVEQNGVLRIDAMVGSIRVQVFLRRSSRSPQHPS